MDEKQNDIVVSVIVITYNHEKYIRQALDSILMQEVNFKYEILIGDDCSTDNTKHILMEYEIKYPQIIKLTLRKQNVGATKNAYDILTKAKGRYLATLEGDDFWINKDKLQIQYDFLEGNKEYIGCCHKIQIVDEENNEYEYKKIDWIEAKRIFTIEDFKGIYLPSQPSSFFRRNIFLNPKYDYSIIYKTHPMIADRVIMLCFLLQGDFFNIEQIMGAYRIPKVKNKHSVTNLVYSNNACMEDYFITEQLEKYAISLFNRKIDFTNRKRDIFASSIIHLIKKPTKENFKISYRIYICSRDYLMSVIIAPIYIMKKIFKRR